MTSRRHARAGAEDVAGAPACEAHRWPRSVPGIDVDRLLLRLWLALPNSRPLPEGFEVLWGTTAAGAVRGGIGQPGV